MRLTEMIYGQVIRLCTLLCTCFLGAGCASESFTIWPGFTEYFKLYPPQQQLPDLEDTKLLQKYRPRIFIARGQQSPIDFYLHYVANGNLHSQGKLVSDNVTAELLNNYRDDPTALFTYSGDPLVDVPATVYARLDHDTLSYQKTEYPLQFLTYNMVFPASGMIKGLGLVPSAALGIVGNLKDWHQLDHYVGLSVVIYEQQPIAIMLQQHNYQTTYLIGPDIELPQDNRVNVDIAMRSNELYLHQREEKKHPAVSFVTAKNIEFMMTGDGKPFLAGYDITNGKKEINYTLQTLPQSDAFYQFKGKLGKTRLLPGRDGPPGADYVTLPALMPRAVRLAAGYRTHSVSAEIVKISALFEENSFSINPDGIKAYKRDFLKATGLIP